MSRPHPALLALAADRPLPPVSDPAQLLASAAEHRCTGLVWTRVEAGELVLPAALSRRLAQSDLLARAHHRRLEQALQGVLSVAGSLDLQLVMAKGLASAARWYDREGERPSNDLDLVLWPLDPPRIAGLVRQLHPGHSFDDRLERVVSRDDVQAIDVLLPGEIEVDLHLDLLKIEAPMRRRELVVEHRVEVVLPGGTRVWALDAELSLIHFALHLNKDGFAQLLGYADVGRILQREELDWAAVERLLAIEGLRVPVLRSIQVVAETLGIAVPGAPVLTGGWRATVWDRLWPPESRLQGSTGADGRDLRQYWIPWLRRGGFVEALQWWVRRRVLPPEVYVRHYYRDVQGPYLWRLLVGRWRKRRAGRGGSTGRV